MQTWAWEQKWPTAQMHKHQPHTSHNRQAITELLCIYRKHNKTTSVQCMCRPLTYINQATADLALTQKLSVSQCMKKSKKKQKQKKKPTWGLEHVHWAEKNYVKYIFCVSLSLYLKENTCFSSFLYGQWTLDAHQGRGNDLRRWWDKWILLGTFKIYSSPEK